jgi:hypothetical protein
MDELYQQHHIRCDARGSPDGWRAVIQVSWSENGATRLRLWVENSRKFATISEAETQGRVLAKKWIDEGKPRL